jgi:hypothetical protein
MKLIIIGSGMSGMLASIANSQTSPCLFEASDSAVGMGSHLAVMRFRDERVPMMLGSEYFKVRVTKAIFYHNTIYKQCTPQFNNLYSIKTSNHLGVRSISNLEDAERFVIKDTSSIRFETSKVFYSHRLVRLECEGASNFAVFQHQDKEVRVGYDFCISTIPLNCIATAAKLAGDTSAFKCSPVWITKCLLGISSSVYQTVYFPSPETAAYRASLEGKPLTIESVDAIKPEDLELVARALGLTPSLYSTTTLNRKRPMGKIIPVEDDFRKSLVCELTDKWSVYSLGRYAIWKSIRSDEVIGDIEMIKKMMHSRYLTTSLRK